MTVGKRVVFDDETWAALDRLRRDRRLDFGQLAAEAFRDLLGKHGRPVGLRQQLRASLRATATAGMDRANDNGSS